VQPRVVLYRKNTRTAHKHDSFARELYFCQHWAIFIHMMGSLECQWLRDNVWNMWLTAKAPYPKMAAKAT
jgi:hypothetical protein